MQAEVELAEVRAGLRGALAARDFQAGESVISLPQSLVVHLASANSHAPVRAGIPAALAAHIQLKNTEALRVPDGAGQRSGAGEAVEGGWKHV